VDHELWASILFEELLVSETAGSPEVIRPELALVDHPRNVSLGVAAKEFNYREHSLSDESRYDDLSNVAEPVRVKVSVDTSLDTIKEIRILLSETQCGQCA